MRHIASLFAGLIIAPLAWLLIGAGTIGLDPDGIYQTTEGRPSTMIAIAMMAGAGVTLGLLAVTRMSPVGPLVVAAVFGGCFALFRFVMSDFALPQAVVAAKIPVESATVAGRSGTVLAIATLMALTVVIPGRWRKRDNDDRVVDTASLATTGATSGDSPDPFALHNSPSTDAPSAGTGYDDRPTDPFASASGGGYGAQQGYGGQYGSQGYGDQRWSYADDGYGGYDQHQQSYSRYGDTHQQSADPQQSYVDHYGYGQHHPQQQHYR